MGQEASDRQAPGGTGNWASHTVAGRLAAGTRPSRTSGGETAIPPQRAMRGCQPSGSRAHGQKNMGLKICCRLRQPPRQSGCRGALEHGGRS